MTDLAQVIVEYIQLLKLSSTSEAKDWTIEFIEECRDWCIFIETEFSTMNQEDRGQCYISVKNQVDSAEQVPRPEELMDAQHQFYKSLLESKYLNNEVYHYVLSHYEFLSRSDKDVLLKDLSSISVKSTTENILQDIFNELNNA